MADVIIHQDIINKCKPVFDQHQDDGFLETSSLRHALTEIELGSTEDEMVCVIGGREEDHKNVIAYETFLLMAMQLTELKALRKAREDDSRAAFITLGLCPRISR